MVHPSRKHESIPGDDSDSIFENHGFLGLNTQHQWKTVIGGSIEYRDRLISSFRDRIKTSSAVENVKVNHDKTITLQVSGETLQFDKVIMASHSDESLLMREDPTELELKLLSSFKYQKNIATVHTDESVMPKKKTFGHLGIMSQKKIIRILPFTG